MKFMGILSLLTVCSVLTEAAQPIGIRHIRALNYSMEVKNVISVDFCYKCLNQSAEDFKETYEELPAFSVLSNDPKGSLSSSFTICGSFSNTDGSELRFFSLVGEDGDRAIQPQIGNVFDLSIYRAAPKLMLGKGVGHAVNKSVPLVFPHQWISTCLAVSTHSGHVEWVIDGQVVENTTLEVIKETGNNFPKNLTGKLVIGAGKYFSGWKSLEVRG